MRERACYHPASVLISKLARVLAIVITAIYPLIVFVGLTRYSARGFAVVLIGVLILLAIARAGGVPRGKIAGAFGPLMPPVAAALIASAFDDRGALLLVPVVNNLGLLLVFATSLRGDRTPMVERFARLREPRLPRWGVAHCRQVTQAWVWFFGINAAVSAGLAILAPLTWWTFYCGAIAYGLIGVMFAAERIVRWRRWVQDPARERGEP